MNTRRKTAVTTIAIMSAIYATPMLVMAWCFTTAGAQNPQFNWAAASWILLIAGTLWTVVTALSLHIFGKDSSSTEEEYGYEESTTTVNHSVTLDLLPALPYVDAEEQRMAIKAGAVIGLGAVAGVVLVRIFRHWRKTR